MRAKKKLRKLERALRAKRPARPRVRKPKPKPELRVVADNVTPLVRAAMKVGDEAVGRSRMVRRARPVEAPAPQFNWKLAAPKPLPGIVPQGEPTLAMDDAIGTQFDFAVSSYAAGLYGEGMFFPGYPYLAELAQRPEYRRISEIIAQEMTRKWIKVSSKGDKDKSERVQELTTALEDLRVQDVCRQTVEKDGQFGRSHVFIDLGVRDDAELAMPLGSGRDSMSRGKIGKGKIKRIGSVEPMYCYPAEYDSSNPLSPNWYNPQSWWVNGKKVHSTRLIPFVGREVPDILKPAYAFGGLSMTQMAKPYVDIWIRNRQSVSDLLHSFSAMVLKTDMSSVLAGAAGDNVFNRAALFNNMRDNSGIMLLDAKEEFDNVSTPLGTLDTLLAQSQEHMCSIAGIPVVKLLGIQPAGLNASSQGEIDTFADSIKAYQVKFFSDKLRRIVDYVMLHLWGEIDEDITFDYVPLEEMSEKELADIRKTEAETDDLHINAGVISTLEVRQRIANDANSPYVNLDADDLPEPPEQDLGGSALNPGQPKQITDQTDPPDDDGAEDVIIAHDEESWVESKHPRKDDGKFGSGSGGGGGAGKVKHVKEVVAHLNKPTAGTSAERVTLRNLLKHPDTPKEAHKDIKAKVIDSFDKHHQKLKSIGSPKAVEIGQKLAAYRLKYGLSKPPSTTAQANAGYSPAVQAQAQAAMKAVLPAGSYTPQETADFNDLASFGGSKAAAWTKIAKGKSSLLKSRGMTVGEGAHIVAYTGNGYRQSNASLRAGTMDEGTWKHVSALNRALDKVPVYASTTYRKADLTAAQAALYQPGNVVLERGFCSTSKSKGTWSGDYHFEIQGKNGRDIEKLSMHPHEEEVLFKSNTSFKVVSKSGNKIVLKELD